jgi:hypothetical protein
MKTFAYVVIFLMVYCLPAFKPVTALPGKEGPVKKDELGATVDVDQHIKVLELRNYLLRAGRRDEFIHYFEETLIQPQEMMGVNILGQYRVKGAEDHFFWMRGFKDMTTRNRFLNDFYYGSFWKQHKALPNSLLLNNDNVYLLKPLHVDSSSENADGFNVTWFTQQKGIAVIDFYISNTKLDKLIPFIKTKYVSILTGSGITNNSFWVSESTANDFPALPVFQDKNLLVQISFYKDEAAYQAKIKIVDSKMSEAMKTDMADLVTTKNTLIIYPTRRSSASSK